MLGMCVWNGDYGGFVNCEDLTPIYHDSNGYRLETFNLRKTEYVL